MTIGTKRNGKEIVIEVTGRLDTGSAPMLDQAINENVQDVEMLILDLNGLAYISSAGLRVLLNAQKKMNQLGAMKVKNVGEEVMSVFEMTGFADILTIE